MRIFSYTLRNTLGIHSSIASQLSAETRKYQSRVTVRKGTRKAATMHISALNGIDARCGDMITVTVDGPDEIAAAEELELFFHRYM